MRPESSTESLPDATSLTYSSPISKRTFTGRSGLPEVSKNCTLSFMTMPHRQENTCADGKPRDGLLSAMFLFTGTKKPGKVIPVQCLNAIP